MPTEPENAQDPSHPAAAGFGRRGALLAAGAALAAGLGAAADDLARKELTGRHHPTPAAPPAEAAAPFHGPRQAGVTAPQQPATQLLAFDLPQTSAAADRQTLRTVLDALTRTLAAAASDAPSDARLQSLGTTRLTSLVGVGPGLATRLGLDVPAALADLPTFPGDRLDPARSGGDLLLQLCAADRWTLTVVAELVATAAGSAGATPRWSQSGFLPVTTPGTTPRNLFGFKDGTSNPAPAEDEQFVWGPPGAHHDGTVLVYRRIRMDVAGFAGLPADQRERTIGRRQGDGVPLTGTAEHDDPDIYAKNPDGSYVIPANAHVRLTSPRLDGGTRMLRRGYSYDDAPTDRGLLFCAFMRDPAQFTRVQNRLATRDALTPYLQHQASAVAYVLPGCAPGGSLGERLWT
ncbi:Dyp-type peroxidase [Kitasatospora viridis]|uniref:Dye decolorizing peroxidase/deferrochelatase/peroxidase EfeB n=1 Tax=Kitasatospora viridis TaxID=281105 RepID=A0A561SDZ0_9ACTN|nr:Dyp-type peroxidase [Kitasatospora viridis]TWF73065.1 dye decolorizing peroxidase/deferrochelatase/peroxidase EfeB [Kitasatospora viridis]